MVRRKRDPEDETDPERSNRDEFQSQGPQRRRRGAEKPDRLLAQWAVADMLIRADRYPHNRTDDGRAPGYDNAHRHHHQARSSCRQPSSWCQDIATQTTRSAGYSMKQQRAGLPRHSGEKHPFGSVAPQATIRYIETSLSCFGAGDARELERKRFIVEDVLRTRAQSFERREIEQSAQGPPDARFHRAAFEAKVIEAPVRNRSLAGHASSRLY